jgi:cell division protein FtsQ
MSTPTRPPASPQWKRVEAKSAHEATRPPEPPERRAETAITDAAKSTASALQAVLTKAKQNALPPVAARRDEREAERRRAIRRRRAIVWGRRVGYVAAAAAAVWVVLLSPLFAMDPAKAQISGYGTVVDPEAVKAVVAGEAGTSLALLSVGHVASELKDIPGVREAHVERSWPDGLVITLESREPVAAIPSRTGGYDLVDDEGTQVGRASRPPAGLPTLQVPADDERVLQSALGVINSLPAELKARVTAISANTEDSVSFKLSKGPLVEWGSAEDSELKGKVLIALLGSKGSKNADVIDVSAPTLPITKSN